MEDLAGARIGAGSSVQLIPPGASGERVGPRSASQHIVRRSSHDQVRRPASDERVLAVFAVEPACAAEVANDVVARASP
jgi:hypothetical protein